MLVVRASSYKEGRYGIFLQLYTKVKAHQFLDWTSVFRGKWHSFFSVFAWFAIHSVIMSDVPLRLDVLQCISCIRKILPPPHIGRAGPPKGSKIRIFGNFEVIFLEILMSRTKTGAGFGISYPKLVKTNHQTFWGSSINYVIFFSDPSRPPLPLCHLASSFG